jgi:hypothetical protein
VAAVEATVRKKKFTKAERAEQERRRKSLVELIAQMIARDIWRKQRKQEERA